jgi:beta-galactosidase
MNTTTRGNNARHDIEYQMWLHEGHIASIRNFPQLLFTGEWQLFDIAVSNRNEGYTICPDGENASTDDNLRRLNNKGLIERDHLTKKDTFYLYKAEWNKTNKFIHICGKDYTKTTGRSIKCYTNDYTDGTTPFYLTYTRNNVDTQLGPVYVSNNDNIVVFPETDFQSGDLITVEGGTTTDTFTIDA